MQLPWYLEALLPRKDLSLWETGLLRSMASHWTISL
jgi:hypothetical protein